MRAIFWGAILLTMMTASARADLAVTNFSAAHPIKIMPVGDSITDDCEVQYAWRQYLQQYLDSNSVPFVFVGRQVSTPPRGSLFTKTNHEGYCGTVIAPPGVYGPVHNYSEAQSYLEKIVPDAFTNARPDLILIMIGANDIGRGRDPRVVAESNMPALLDIIFSNVPNANVILDKPTNLRSGNVSGLLYGNYATNVPIYGAALQAMVNQRRAQGQNVSLADMFSAVDYKTMFMSDHVHPNATGLKAVAQEWFTRIRAILTDTNQITATLIHGGDLWNFSDSGTDLGTNWSQPDFDDSGWNQGYARFGFGEPTDETTINNSMTVYLRKTFVVPWNEVFTNLNFRLAQTGGAVVWLNGRELFRTNLPSGPVAFGAPATTNLTGDSPNIYYQTNIAGTNLLIGTNVIAVEAHQSSSTNAALGFDLELLGGAIVLPPPTLAATFSATNLVLTWPANNASGFMLYTTTNVAGGAWQPAGAAAQTNAGQVSVSLAPGAGEAYFRLQRNQ